jgi:hypothetical protein
MHSCLTYIANSCDSKLMSCAFLNVSWNLSDRSICLASIWSTSFLIYLHYSSYSFILAIWTALSLLIETIWFLKSIWNLSWFVFSSSKTKDCLWTFWNVNSSSSRRLLTMAKSEFWFANLVRCWFCISWTGSIIWRSTYLILVSKLNHWSSLDLPAIRENTSVLKSMFLLLPCFFSICKFTLACDSYSFYLFISSSSSAVGYWAAISAKFFSSTWCCSSIC